MHELEILVDVLCMLAFCHLQNGILQVPVYEVHPLADVEMFRVYEAPMFRVVFIPPCKGA